MRNTNRRSRGFTLAESLIASVVLVTAAVGVFETLTACAQQTRAFDFESAATGMGKSLMEEIAARGFDPPATNDQPGAAYQNGVPDRSNYDDIADFAGYTDTVSADEVDAEGLRLRSLTFGRVVSIQFRRSPEGVGVSPRTSDAGFAMVTVAVVPPGGSGAAPVAISRLMSRVNRE